MWNKALIVSVVLTSLLLAACGSETSETDSTGLDKYFPATVEATGLERGDEIRLFVGDSLWEYINGGAELYHAYGFVDVTTADYRSTETELVLDLYRFATPEGAYGLYSALRPDEPNSVPYGVEGHSSGSSLEFVKGDIMVRLIAYDESEATRTALAAVAAQMNESLPGSAEPPAMFALLPTENAVPHSDRIVGEGYLGQSFLENVYTRDYIIGEESVTLFLIKDSAGAVMAEWFTRITEAERSPISLADLPFDEDYYLQVSNDFYGEILAGLVNGKLAGVVNFSDQQISSVAAWLQTLAR